VGGCMSVGGSALDVRGPHCLCTALCMCVFVCVKLTQDCLVYETNIKCVVSTARILSD